MNVSLKSYKEAYAASKAMNLNANTGNLLWNMAAFRLLNLDKSEHCIMPCSKGHFFEQSKEESAVVYWPTANFLQVSLDEQAARISRNNRRYIVVGLGTQAFFYRNMSKLNAIGIHPGVAPNNSASDYPLWQGGISFLEKLQSSGMPVFVRGDFTRNVSRRYGLSSAYSAGCPTLLLNPLLDMGKLLEEKYRNLATVGKSSELKVALNLNQSPSVVKLLMAIYKRYPRSIFFAQTQADLKRLEEEGVPFDRTRIFWSVEEWQRSICHFDLSIGVRIHGTMTALSCPDPVPVVIIAADYRVKELADVMMVPHIPSFEKSLLNFSGDVHDLLQLVSLDGPAFDNNRCRIAKMYDSGFEGAGLKSGPVVKSIAHNC